MSASTLSAASAPDRETTAGVTSLLAERISALRFTDLPAPVVTVARQSLLDWLGVCLAARDEPLVDIISAVARDEGGAPQAALIGRAERVSLLQAALVNGAMGHALDYDDVNAMGHPTAPVAPVVLALGEKLGASGADVLTAFVAGYEIETRVGLFMGPSHYDRGWHSTATCGAFGAAAAAGRLLGLSPALLAHAFGLAGTQAAGLKCMFGTMSKPLHAGLAAQAGLRAALLAARGFTSNPAVLEAAQGFGDTQSSAPRVSRAFDDPPGGFHLPANLFKHHAACYLTHSTIEAIGALRIAHDLTPQAVSAIRVEVAPTHLKVCDIAEPRTGLECKFSIRTMAALALAGEDTADERLYSDEIAARPDLAHLRALTSVVPTSSGTLAHVELRLADGRTLRASRDVGVPETDLAEQQARLEAKFVRLARGVVEPDRAVRACANLVRARDLTELISAVTYP